MIWSRKVSGSRLTGRRAIDARASAPHLLRGALRPFGSKERRKRMRSLLLFPLCALAFAAPAHSEEAAPPVAEHDRYSMTPAEGGFLRLDKRTGAVSFCTVKDGLSLCRESADERAALEAEVSRLTLENEQLKNRLAGAQTARPNAPPLPSEDEFERTLSFTERFLRRIMRIFREEAPGEKS
jgi:hypothetical protein